MWRRPLSVPAVTLLLLAGCGASADAGRHAIASSLPRQVTVGTYNVHWLGEPERLRADFAALPQVDVWCLQEVRLPATEDDAAAADRLRRLLPTGAWDVAVERVNRLGEIGSEDWECQAIASRLPIRGRETWPLADEAGAKRRVALAVTLELDGRATLRVVDTDHAPSFFAWHDRNGAQVERLAARLAATDGPTVVAGDFNCAGNVFRLYDNEAHVARVDERLVAAGFRSGPCRHNTFHAGLVAVRIDRLYARGVDVGEAHVAIDASGSDHRPVWCTLR